MRQDQAIAVDVEHRDWIVITTARVIGSSFRHHLVHKRGAAGSDAQRHAYRGVHSGLWPHRCVAFPISYESFQPIKRQLSGRLWRVDLLTIRLAHLRLRQSNGCDAQHQGVRHK